MTKTKRPYLRAINPIPGSVMDHGAHLTEMNGQISTEKAEIMSKLDLIFAWPELSNSTATTATDSSVILPCRLSCDSDESVPTELFIIFPSDTVGSRFSMLKKIKISVELFRTCYQFDVEIISTDSLTASSPTIITSVPAAITTLRARNLPRVRVSEDRLDSIPNVVWRGDDGKSANFQVVSELGLNSIAGILPVDVSSGSGEVLIGNLSIRGRCIRKKAELHVFQLQIESLTQFGRVFDLYRQVAFPDLRARSEFTTQQLYALYTKTRYLSQFIGSADDSKLLQDLSVVWENVAKSQHVTSADYVTVDDANELCGASSLTCAFTGKSYSVWAFHQLCSVASPNLLDRSGQLYLWRAEYLYARPEPLKVIVWFRSASRWLERIYVKFEMLTHGKSKLRPVAWVRGTYKRSNSKEPGAEVAKIQFGALSRSASYGGPDGEVCAAADPEYLNACASLNGALNLNEDPSGIESMKAPCDAVLAQLGKTEYQMQFTLAHGAAVPDGYTLHPSDRFLVIEKEDLGDFLSCIEHSVSLTRKKYSA